MTTCFALVGSEITITEENLVITDLVPAVDFTGIKDSSVRHYPSAVLVTAKPSTYSTRDAFAKHSVIKAKVRLLLTQIHPLDSNAAYLYTDVDNHPSDAAPTKPLPGTPICSNPPSKAAFFGLFKGHSNQDSQIQLFQ